MSEANGQREHLEQRANEVRAKLEHRLRLIDERRHHLTDVARVATRPPMSIVLLAAAGAVTAIFVVQRLRARRAPTAMELLARLLQPPPPPEQNPVGPRLRKAVTSLALLAVERVGRQRLDRWLAEPSAQPGP